MYDKSYLACLFDKRQGCSDDACANVIIGRDGTSPVIGQPVAIQA